MITKLLSIYPDIDREILKGYEYPDEFLVVNDNDPDLQPITIPLPECPPLKDWHKIDGFGKKASQQKFTRQEMPDRIMALQKKNIPLDKIWDEIKQNYGDYKDEVAWINKQVRRRLKGYWCFINGKLTYIDGWQYFYCNFWKLGGKLPDYRDRDRKFFHFARFCYNDPFCFGMAYPKHRQEGASYRTACIGFCLVSTHKNKQFGIQSKDDDSAEKVYLLNVLAPFLELPFFFKPQYDGSSAPKKKLSMQRSASKTGSTGAIAYSEMGLSSNIFYAPASPKKFDTFSDMIFYYQDETGKTEAVDISDRWSKVKPAMHQGAKIHGFTMATSTVDEMTKGGGAQFLEFCKNSNYHKRLVNNQTPTGLYTLFIPATEGAVGFIGEYGESIMEEPTRKQQEYLLDKWIKSGKLETEFFYGGSKKYYDEYRSSLLASGDLDGYMENVRQFPIRYADCWRMSQKNSGFNLVDIENRISELNFNDPLRNFDLDWEGRPFASKVRFIETPPNATTPGKYYASIVFDGNIYKSNNIEYDSHLESYVPCNKHIFIAGADGYNFERTKSNRQSNAAFVVRERRNFNIDPDGTPINEWRTPRFVCHYYNRPKGGKSEVAEDLLKLCIYFGCQVSIEYEGGGGVFLGDYFEKDHPEYKGLLYYSFNRQKQEFEINPGENLKGNKKQRIFQLWQEYLKRYAHRENHKIILEQARDIQGIASMKDFDIFSAGGQTLLADDPIYEQLDKISTESFEISDYFWDAQRLM